MSGRGEGRRVGRDWGLGAGDSEKVKRWVSINIFKAA